ncbi:type II toxin-antitoxin system PemK/MazF family toxin [Nostoc sp. T09]|uniref:type II toxin-antitoxin system PemK/MazF family toxin n=1 Tax=Nostoc sp. T09 TaxID=1932621 RepID=UPI00211AEDAC|nr:type II toxin-antitoxin system PemK/MazF family toxin [Nostoc sp. T09]
MKATPTNGLDQDRFINIGQIRAVDNRRVLEMLGVLEDEYWEQIRTALNVVLGFVD